MPTFFVFVGNGHTRLAEQAFARKCAADCRDKGVRFDDRIRPPVHRRLRAEFEVHSVHHRAAGDRYFRANQHERVAVGADQCQQHRGNISRFKLHRFAEEIAGLIVEERRVKRRIREPIHVETQQRLRLVRQHVRRIFELTGRHGNGNFDLVGNLGIDRLADNAIEHRLANLHRVGRIGVAHRIGGCGSGLRNDGWRNRSRLLPFCRSRLVVAAEYGHRPVAEQADGEDAEHDADEQHGAALLFLFAARFLIRNGGDVGGGFVRIADGKAIFALRAVDFLADHAGVFNEDVCLATRTRNVKAAGHGITPRDADGA